MEHTTGHPSLSTVQQCVVNALAVGSTLTGAAEAYGVHRVTVYRWIKTHEEFSAALREARAEFVLARRDDLYHLSNRALETVLAVLDNPKSSPAVLLRTAMFVLQRPQVPKTGWSMPEPAPDPDGEKLVDSAILEQDYDRLPGLYNIERDAPAETPAETENPGESAASEPPPPAESPVPPPADVSRCNQMQHDLQNCDDVAPAACDPVPPPPAESPVPPPADVSGCNRMQHNLQNCDDVAPPTGREAHNNHGSVELQKEDPPANANQNETEEILV
jgi:hypothetical protein